MNDKDFLEHFGIPGMKWGHKKGSSILPSTKKDKVESDDHKAVKSLKGKSISEMSNKELELLTRRMQLEKQYKSLKKDELTKGKSVVDGILKAGKTATEIYNLYNSPIGKALRTQITQKTKG